MIRSVGKQELLEWTVAKCYTKFKKSQIFQTLFDVKYASAFNPFPEPNFR